MHLFQPMLYIFQSQQPVLNLIRQLRHLTSRSNQSCQINPTAQADFAIRTQRRAYLVQRPPLAFLKTADQTVAQELLNTYRVQLPAMSQRRIANLAVLVSVNLRVLAAQGLQLVQNLTAAPHLLHGVRTQQVEIDLVQLMRILAIVTLRPFLRVTDRTYGTKISAGYQETLRIILYQI